MHVYPLSDQEMKSSLVRIQFSCTSQATPRHKTRTARTRGRRNDVRFQRVGTHEGTGDAKPLHPMTRSARITLVPCLLLFERIFELDGEFRGCEKEGEVHITRSTTELVESQPRPTLCRVAEQITVREVALDPEIGGEQPRFQVLHGELDLAPDPEQLSNVHSSLDPGIAAKLVKSNVSRPELRLLPLLSFTLLLL